MIRRFNIAGFATCSAYKQAVAAISGLQAIFPTKFSLVCHEYTTKDEYMVWLTSNRTNFGLTAESHKTSPFVWFEDGHYLGI
jgi:hypothetical protein